MPTDDTGHLKARRLAHAIAAGLVVAVVAPSVASGQAPPDPNAEKQKQQKQQQKQQPPPPPQKGAAPGPQVQPKGPPPPQVRSAPPPPPKAPPQQQVAPSFERRAPGSGAPADRRGPPVEPRRADPLPVPKNIPPGPPPGALKQPPPPVQAAPKGPPAGTPPVSRPRDFQKREAAPVPPPGQPPLPPQVQGAPKAGSPPGKLLPPTGGKGPAAASKDGTPPLPDRLRRPDGTVIDRTAPKDGPKDKAGAPIGSPPGGTAAGSGPPPLPKGIGTSPPTGVPDSKLPKSATPTAPAVVPPGGTVPPGLPKGAGTAPPAATAPGLPVTQGGSPAAVTKPAGPIHLDQVRKERVQTVTPTGQTVIQEPGNRTIVKQDNRVFVTRNESTVIQNFAPGAKSSRRNDGVTETVFARPDGSRVFTETDRDGRLLRRYRRDGGGREINFVDNRRFYRNLAIGVGAAAIATAVLVSLPRASHALPREKYIVEYDRASDDDIYECLTAPPVERLERTYSLDEIRYSPSLRERVRRVDLDSINFETGSFEVTPDQYGKLERIARAIGRAIEANPAEVFLIEGHTDAVGSDEDNASLSDRRAEAVARILVEHYQIPVENLVTQGYGEQYLKVDTQDPDRANRRVAMRRITPLLSQQE